MKEYFKITYKIWVIGFIILTLTYSITLNSIKLAILSSLICCVCLFVMNFILFLYNKQ